MTVWKSIDTDGVPDSDREVLTAIVWNPTTVDYGIGMFEDGEWWHTCSENEPPTHYSEFERLPVSALQRSPDTGLAIAGLRFPSEEVCPKPLPYMEDSKNVARNLVSAINQQSEMLGCLAGEVQSDDGGVVTFKIWRKNDSAIEASRHDKED